MTQTTNILLKPTRIPWIGNIPEDWGVKRLKYIAKIETGYTPPKADAENYSEDGIPWIKPDNLDRLNYLSDSSEKISKKGLVGNPIIHKDDILVCCIGTVGKMGVAGCDLTFNQQINSVQFGMEVDKEFGKFMILSSQEEHLRTSQVVVVPILNKTKQSNIYFTLPPLSTQITIANFLDQKTEQISTLISNKKKLINLLKEQKQSIIHRAVTKGIDTNVKMKDSGVPWIGEIPEDWEVMRTKNLIREGKGGIKPGPFGSDLKSEHIKEVGNFKVYTQENIISGNPSIGSSFISDDYYNKLIEFAVQENDLLISSRGTIGRVLIIGNDYTPGVIHSSVIRLRINQRKVLNKFLKIVIESSDYFLENLLLISNATTIEVIYGEKLKESTIVLPPLLIQKTIVEYIEKETAQIDTAIEKIEKEIILIEEYRVSLIYQAVTGKITIS